jgi:hypothetical protein
MLARATQQRVVRAQVSNLVDVIVALTLPLLLPVFLSVRRAALALVGFAAAASLAMRLGLRGILLACTSLSSWMHPSLRFSRFEVLAYLVSFGLRTSFETGLSSRVVCL